MSWLTLLLSFVGAAAGTFGFSVLLRTPKRAWLPSALLGGAGYLLYILLTAVGLSDAVSMLLSAAFASFTAYRLARRLHIISTVFLSMSIIPLVPGLGLYRCMSYIGASMADSAFSAGTDAMVVILMIVLGVSVGSFLNRLLPYPDKKKATRS